MRTLIDTVCPGCGDVHVDVWIDTTRPRFPLCARCGQAHVRHRRASAAAHSDSYRGGIWIEHGLCHPDGEPRRYDSQSEIDREAKRRGLVNWVEHTPDPGSDRSATTQRFV
jgi:hypothetical protein